MWLLIGLAAVALLLAVPLELSFAFDSRPAGHRPARLRWGFGLVRVRLPRGSPTRKPTSRRSRLPRVGRRARAALGTPRLRATILRRARRIVGSIRVRTFELRVDLGTGDPADTGVLFGALAGAQAALPAGRAFPIAIVPDFDEERSDVWLRGDVRVIPGVVVGHALAAVLSPAGLHALIRMARA